MSRKNDEETVESYRQCFASGPVGVWRTPHEYDEDYGTMFVFHDDCTGVGTLWDTALGEHEEIPFKWRVLGPGVMEVDDPGGEGDPGGWRTSALTFRCALMHMGMRGL